MSTNADKILRTFHFRSDVPATHIHIYRHPYLHTDTTHRRHAACLTPAVLSFRRKKPLITETESNACYFLFLLFH